MSAINESWAVTYSLSAGRQNSVRAEIVRAGSMEKRLTALRTQVSRIILDELDYTLRLAYIEANQLWTKREEWETKENYEHFGTVTFDDFLVLALNYPAQRYRLDLTIINAFPDEQIWKDVPYTFLYMLSKDHVPLKTRAKAVTWVREYSQKRGCSPAIDDFKDWMKELPEADRDWRFKQGSKGSTMREQLEVLQVKWMLLCQKTDPKIVKEIEDKAERMFHGQKQIAVGTNDRSVSEVREVRSQNGGMPLLGFEAFWKEYPKKVAKQMAFVAWKKISAPLPKILDGIERWKKSEQWKDPQFIPYPATFLNQRRWEDEVPNGARQASREQQRGERSQQAIQNALGHRSRLADALRADISGGSDGGTSPALQDGAGRHSPSSTSPRIPSSGEKV